jgi:hypothetical protein
MSILTRVACTDGLKWTVRDGLLEVSGPAVDVIDKRVSFFHAWAMKFVCCMLIFALSVSFTPFLAAPPLKMPATIFPYIAKDPHLSSANAVCLSCRSVISFFILFV